MKRIRLVTGFLGTLLVGVAIMAAAHIVVQSCSGRQDAKDSIVFETETFTLTVGKDAIARSLVIKETKEEMLLKGTGVPLFSVTQDRPFNNEIKLEHPNTRTTYAADSLAWDGERLIVGFDTAPYEAIVKVDKEAGYLKFTLEDFICEPEDYGHLAMDIPPVAEFRILQLPVKEREQFGEWLNCMWDDRSAACVAGCDPLSLIWHEDYAGGRILTADLYSGKKLRGGSAALIAAAGKEPFLNVMDKFETDLGLPRGVQSRRSPMLNRSIYWTQDAVPSNIDRHIETAKKAGLKMMLFYYPCFIKSHGYSFLGDYDLRDDYPGGYDDIKAMIDKVKAAGITPGFHTLQTHIGIKSRYVTPSIDPRLNRKRQFTLKEAIPASGEVSEITVEENPVDSPLHDYTRVIAFGGEGFAYEGYTTEPPYKFTGVTRRAYDTDATAHRKGEIGGILDISEFGRGTSIYVNQDNDLQDEIAEKIARIYDCGFEFLYLDGSEGVNVPFGINVSLAQYRVAAKLGKMPVFTEGAAKAHFGWHLQAGANAFDVFAPEIFKEKIVEFPYTEAPRMAKNMTRVDFGWWNITPRTTPDMWNFGDSLAAEMHCPVTIQFSFKALEANPHADELLAVLKKWEEYREKEAKASNDLDAEYAVNLIKAGEKAPDFSLTGLDGKTYTLNDFKGKTLVLDFWATWCPDCREEIDDLIRIHKEHPEVEFVGISFDTDPEQLRAFTAEHGMDWLQLSEGFKKWKETQVSEAYGVKWIPSKYIISPKGKVLLSTVMTDKVEKFLNR